MDHKITELYLKKVLVKESTVHEGYSFENPRYIIHKVRAVFPEGFDWEYTVLQDTKKPTTKKYDAVRQVKNMLNLLGKQADLTYLGIVKS